MQPEIIKSIAQTAQEKARICYWGISETGEIVPLVGDPDEGWKDARNYGNFIGFQHDCRHTQVQEHRRYY